LLAIYFDVKMIGIFSLGTC